MAPWEYNPVLQRDRLIAIGNLIQQGRNDALDRFNPGVGCMGWTVGCEAFAFQKYQIEQAATELDWLEILDPTMHFVFAIGGVPVRFYRGEPSDPNERTLRQSFVELQQMSMFTAEEMGSSLLLNRFAVETDLDGSISAITFVVLSGESPVLSWQLPLEAGFSKVARLWGDSDEGVELPAPIVRIPGSERKDGTSDQ